MSEPLFDDTDDQDHTSETLEFSDYPSIGQLIHHHTPGFDYLIGLATNVAKFHAGGWRQVINRTPFMIRGEAFLLFRKGSPVWGGNPADCLPVTHIDADADRLFCLNTPGRVEGPKLGEAPTPVGTPIPLPDTEGDEVEPLPTPTPLRRSRAPLGLADPPTKPTLHMPTTVAPAPSPAKE